MQDSFKRVETLLLSKDKELRNLACYLYEHDTLNAEEMDRVIRGKGLEEKKEKVRKLQEGMFDGTSVKTPTFAQSYQ